LHTLALAHTTRTLCHITVPALAHSPEGERPSAREILQIRFHFLTREVLHCAHASSHSAWMGCTQGLRVRPVPERRALAAAAGRRGGGGGGGAAVALLRAAAGQPAHSVEARRARGAAAARLAARHTGRREPRRRADAGGTPATPPSCVPQGNSPIRLRRGKASWILSERSSASAGRRLHTLHERYAARDYAAIWR
jgi:hypothetical protein